MRTVKITTLPREIIGITVAGIGRGIPFSLHPNTGYGRAKKTEALYSRHVGCGPHLLTDQQQDLVLFLDAAPHVRHFGIGRAVITRVTKPVTVWAHLFQKAEKLWHH